METEGQFFEISLVYDIHIRKDEFEKPNVINSEFIKGSEWFFMVLESNGLYMLYLSVNEKIFFSRKNLCKEINELGLLIDSICKSKKFLYGVANYVTNSLFVNEPFKPQLDNYAIKKSAFIFLNNDIDEKNYLNPYHLIFEFSKCRLLYNPLGQILWPVSSNELKNNPYRI